MQQMNGRQVSRLPTQQPCVRPSRVVSARVAAPESPAAAVAGEGYPVTMVSGGVVCPTASRRDAHKELKSSQTLLLCCLSHGSSRCVCVSVTLGGRRQVQALRGGVLVHLARE